MAIIRRLSRLFKADFHAVLDRIEEPEALLKQAVREMEEALLQSKQTIKQLEAEKQQISANHDELTQTLDDLSEQLTLCFNSDNDELARPLVRKQLETQQMLKIISKKQASLEKQLSEHKSQYQEHSALYESTRQKAEVFSKESELNSHLQNDIFDVRKGPSEIQDNEVEIALMQQKQRFEQAHSNANKPNKGGVSS